MYVIAGSESVLQLVEDNSVKTHTKDMMSLQYINDEADNIYNCKY